MGELIDLVLSFFISVFQKYLLFHQAKMMMCSESYEY